MPNQVTAPGDEHSIAQWIINQTTSVLSDAVHAPMQALFEALMPLIIVGLTIQFMVYAFAITQGNGNMTVTEFFKKAIMVAIISAFFGSSGLFQSNIAEMMIALPDDISNITTGSSNISAEIDRLQNETTKATSAITGASSDGFFSFLPSGREVMLSILAFFLRISIAIVSAIMVVLILICKVGVSLVVATAPIFIGALLFEPTKKMFNSWVSTALTYVFLALMAGLVIGFLLEMHIAVIRMVATRIEVGVSDIMAVIGANTLVSLASIVVLIFLPGMSANLSGGFGAQLGIGSSARGGAAAARIASGMKAKPTPSMPPSSGGSVSSRK